MCQLTVWCFFLNINRYHTWQKKAFKSSKISNLGSSVQTSMISQLLVSAITMMIRKRRYHFFQKALWWCTLDSKKLRRNSNYRKQFNNTLSFNLNFCILMLCIIQPPLLILLYLIRSFPRALSFPPIKIWTYYISDHIMLHTH